MNLRLLRFARNDVFVKRISCMVSAPGCITHLATENNLARPRASPIGHNQKVKRSALADPANVFHLRLSFRRLAFLRRRRKADYGEKQKTKSSSLKKAS